MYGKYGERCLENSPADEIRNIHFETGSPLEKMNDKALVELFNQEPDWEYIFKVHKGQGIPDKEMGESRIVHSSSTHRIAIPENANIEWYNELINKAKSELRILVEMTAKSLLKTSFFRASDFGKIKLKYREVILNQFLSLVCDILIQSPGESMELDIPVDQFNNPTEDIVSAFTKIQQLLSEDIILKIGYIRSLLESKTETSSSVNDTRIMIPSLVRRFIEE